MISFSDGSFGTGSFSIVSFSFDLTPIIQADANIKFNRNTTVHIMPLPQTEKTNKLIKRSISIIYDN